MAVILDALLFSLHKELTARLGLEEDDTFGTSHLTNRSEANTNELSLVYNSISWRVTKPLRWVNTALISLGVPTGRIRNLSQAFMWKLKQDGFSAALSKARDYLGKRYLSKTNNIRRESILFLNDGGEHVPANKLFGRSVSLICESTLPQCYKYRVSQKANMLRMLGVTVNIIDWRNTDKSISMLQTCAMVIFYRVPFFKSVQSIYAEAKRLGVPTFWEVDDLIFDAERYKSNSNMKSLSRDIVKELLDGADLYGACYAASDYGLASTRKLQEVMSISKRTWVVENALDKQTLEIARGLRREKKLRAVESKQTIDIMYGSGTKTHDMDFKEAEKAIISVLAKRANTRFIVMGDLNVSQELESSPQFVRYPAADFKTYLRKLSLADISIAPLEASEFNEAKSNIKYLEASVLNLPSVCTPTAPFGDAIVHGVNGYLARSVDEWELSLLELVDNQEKRKSVANNAHRYVYKNYSPYRIAHRQLLPVLKNVIISKTKKRILSVNVHFSPNSFGGATIITEQMVSNLSQNDAEEHFVFTIGSDINGPDYSLRRYRACGAEVIGVKIPEYRPELEALFDKRIRRIFGEIIESIQPDLVHFHSIQGLGLSMIDACLSVGVPYVVTVHDAWWLCGRQFMVNDRGVFCGQYRIDPLICSICVNNTKLESYRRDMSLAALNAADLILAPSEYIRNLHIANGIDPERIRLNKNGVGEPCKLTSPPNSRPLTFGYVGGKTEIKGWDIVVKAFNELSDRDIRLVLVDNTLNMGFRSVDNADFVNKEKVEIVDAYNQDTIDEFFATIDILLFPTQAMESFGLTVREAQIRGKWVISTASGGVIEDIEDGINGTIIPISKNYRNLVDAMTKLIDNPKTMENRGKVQSHITTFTEQADNLRMHYASVLGREQGLVNE